MRGGSDNPLLFPTLSATVGGAAGVDRAGELPRAVAYTLRCCRKASGRDWRWRRC